MSREAMIEAAAQQFHADIVEGFEGVDIEFSESDMAWLLHCAAKFATACIPMGGTAASTLKKFNYSMRAQVSA